MKSSPPQYWPKNEKWPLIGGEYISSELESLPPVFIISVGDKEVRKVKGESNFITSPIKKVKNILKKSKYWPKNEKWPLKKGEYISAEIESLPPVFLISVGDKVVRMVRGEIKSKSKRKSKSQKKLKSQKKSKKSKNRR
jgi:hypothetical protein